MKKQANIAHLIWSFYSHIFRLSDLLREANLRLLGKEEPVIFSVVICLVLCFTYSSLAA